MKTTKRFASIATAALLAACVAVPMVGASVPASAEDEGTILIQQIGSDTAAHTYSAYKIFSGTVVENQLTEIDWADSTNGESILNALKDSSKVTSGSQLYDETEKASYFANCNTAADVASVLNGHTDDDAFMQAFAKIVGDLSTSWTADATSTTTSGSNATINLSQKGDGYYLVVDTTADSMTDGARTRYVLHQIDADGAQVTQEVKTALPTVDKQVEDDDEGTSKAYYESADHEIGESFHFKLTATLDADGNYASYNTYKVQFNDTMSKGVAFEQIDSVTVTGKDSEGTAVEVTVSGSSSEDKHYTAVKAGTTETVSNDGSAEYSWTLTIDDLKALSDGDNKKLDLTKGATIEVIYSAHLTKDAILLSDNGDGSTYYPNLGSQAESNKINANKVSLTYSNNPNGSGEGTTTEDNVYVAAYEFNVEKRVDSAAGAKAGDARFKLVVKKDGGTVTKVADFNSGTGSVTWVDPTYDETETTKLTNGTELEPKYNATSQKYTFDVKGLDAGTYYLVETTVPEGYNKADDMEVTIGATHYETGNDTDDTKNGTDGSAVYKIEISDDGSIIVNNKSGSTLPSTGGIGTKIFYTVGGLLVAGAGVTLIVKKRMRREEEEA